MARALVLGLLLLLPLPSSAEGQNYARGQNVAVAYEGWEQNTDGSFNLVFGYMNRNWKEELDVPIGPENSIEPGGPDLGQPTHFLPRRNRFVFRVRVPADFGDGELVWTLTTKGKTEKAYASLNPDFFIDDLVIQANYGAGGASASLPDLVDNRVPQLEVEGATERKATVGRPNVLVANVTDDDLPHRRSLAPDDPIRPTRFSTDSATGLRLSWFVYRGPANVVFDPPQIKVWEDTRGSQDSPWSPGWATPNPPADGRWKTEVTFTEPGTYVLRCQAHDGGLATTQDVIFVVSPSSTRNFK